MTPGSYTLTNLTVNQEGQLTAASSGSAVTSVAAGTGLTATPSPITGTGSLAITATGVTAGSYTNTALTVNAQGQLTAASSGTGIPTTGNAQVAYIVAADSQNFPASPNPPTTVVYTTPVAGFTFVNIGGNLDTTTGLYTAPVAGVYAVNGGITVDSTSVTNDEVTVQLVLEGSNIFALAMAGNQVEPFSPSTSGLVYATAGQTISMQGIYVIGSSLLSAAKGTKKASAPLASKRASFRAEAATSTITIVRAFFGVYLVSTGLT